MSHHNNIIPFYFVDCIWLFGCRLEDGLVNLVKSTLNPALFSISANPPRVSTPSTSASTSEVAGVDTSKATTTATLPSPNQSQRPVSLASSASASSKSSLGKPESPVVGISRSASMADVGINKRASMSSFINAYGQEQGLKPRFIVADTMEIFVQFGKLASKSAKDTKIHVTYETCLALLNPNTNLISAVYAFDGYRSLYNDLKAAGCTNVDPFPPTYTQSSLGIALSKEQLAERYP